MLRIVAHLVSLLMVLGAWTSDARADEGRVAAPAQVVQVERDPSACLAADPLQQQLQVWLRREALPAGVTLEVRAGPTPPEAEFALRIEGEVVGRRRFDHLPTSCAQRTAALGLAMAVALDEGILDQLRSPGPRAPRHALEHTTPLAPPASSELWVTLGAGAQYGMLPRWGGLASLGLGWSGAGPWAIQAQVAGTARESVALGRGQADVAALFGVLEGCGQWRLSGHALSLCAGALGGAQFARGEGFSESQRARLPWVAAIASVGVRFWHARRAGLWMRAAGHVQILTPELQVRSNEGEILVSRSTPPAGVSGLWGVWFRLP